MLEITHLAFANGCEARCMSASSVGSRWLHVFYRARPSTARMLLAASELVIFVFLLLLLLACLG